MSFASVAFTKLPDDGREDRDSHSVFRMFFQIAKDDMWKIYAILSAFFAALTAIFAKVGVKDINPDLDFSCSLRSRHRAFMAFLFQGTADRGCIKSRPDRQTQRCHHHSACVSLPEGAGQSEGHSRSTAYNSRKHHHAHQIEAPACATRVSQKQRTTMFHLVL